MENNHNPEEWISHSQLHDWLSCRHRWYLRYGAGIKPVQKSVPMDLGIAVHNGLASFFKGGYVAQGISEWQAEAMKGIPVLDDSLAERIEEIRYGAILIIDRTLADFKARGLWIAEVDGIPLVEKEYRYRLPDAAPMGVQGILDLVAYDPQSKTNWLVDFKVRGVFQDDASEEVSLQNAMYQMLGRLHGIPIVGTITYQVASKPPTKPKIKKDGDMSRARIACDWDTYRAALIAHDLNPADYEEEMKPKLDVEFVRPLKAYRSEEFVTNIWDTIVVPSARAIGIARGIVSGHNTTPETRDDTIRQVFVRNLSQRMCNGCAVRSVCLGTLKGYDPAGILQAEYTYRPERVKSILGLQVA